MNDLPHLKPTFLGAKLYSVSTVSKRDFLLFDQIVSPEINKQISFTREPAKRADLQWLIDRGLITDFDFSGVPLAALPGGSEQNFSPNLGLWLFAATFGVMEASINDWDEESAVVAQEIDVESALLMLGTSLQVMSDQTLGMTASCIEAVRGISCTPVRESFSPLTSQQTFDSQTYTTEPSFASLLSFCEEKGCIRRFRVVHGFCKPLDVPCEQRLPCCTSVFGAVVAAC